MCSRHAQPTQLEIDHMLWAVAQRDLRSARHRLASQCRVLRSSLYIWHAL